MGMGMQELTYTYLYRYIVFSKISVGTISHYG
jgi:hypothetical protein